MLRLEAHKMRRSSRDKWASSGGVEFAEMGFRRGKFAPRRMKRTTYLYYSINDVFAFCKKVLHSWIKWASRLLPFWLVPSWVLLPFTLLYFFYVRVPVAVVTSCWTFISAVVATVSRRSTHTRQMTIQLTTLWSSLLQLWESLINVKLSELLLTVFQSIYEVFSSWPQSQPESQPGIDGNNKSALISNLLMYEERESDTEGPDDAFSQRRVRSQMHHYVPPNPFRAVVKASLGIDGALVAEPTEEVDSPASFPPTPFSRARVMSRSTERVVSTMFAARDRLRMEAQSASRDEYSRKAAVEAQSSGQMAVFDARQTSDGLALTCGNHCALKVGKGMCCSSRAMMPVRVNTFVYIEFSVTAQAGQTPLLALGLAPPDFPLNAMVGSWPRSFSLYQDGQLLIGSKWFQGSGSIIEAGSTIGFLVYLPGTSEPASLSGGGGGAKRAQATPIKHPSLRVQVSSARRVADGGVGSNTGNAISKSTSRSSSKDPSPQIKGGGDDDTLEETLSPPASSLLEAGCTSPELSVPTPFTLSVCVNGRAVSITDEIREAAYDVLAAHDAPLFPTISLLSQDTRVWCRFCEADIMYRSRALVKAPPGVKVYCLDGSLLLNDSD